MTEALIAAMRQLAELTGETTSRLYEWGSMHSGLMPFMRARQTFYTALAQGGWERKNRLVETRTCRLGSFPFSCELRLRLISLETQFRADARSHLRRRLMLLWGYEKCSGLLHFRFYRGQALEPEEHDLVARRLPATVVVDFIAEMARMVGLPIQSVLATNDLVELPGPPMKGYLVSLDTQALLDLVRSPNGKNQSNTIPFRCDVTDDHNCPEVEHFELDHPLSQLCRTTSATALVDQLSDWVKAHNLAFAFPRLEKGRDAFSKRHKDALARAVQRTPDASAKTWGLHMSDFLRRMDAAEYLKEAMSIHDVRYFKRHYQDFTLVPGDM